MAADARASEGPLARPRRAYRAAAILLLNTAILFLLANLLAMAWLAVERRWLAPPAGALAYGADRLAAVYPGWAPGEIERLLTETWSRRYVYRPFVQHREAPQSGRYVNVDANGFRHGADQGPWPPTPERLNVFAFGGSTTFGYGLPDDQTLPSRLQAHLREAGCPRPPAVYNFGGGNFYSEQERILFERLLVEGHVPAAAVFVDGLNEWKDEPKFTRKIEALMAESEPRLAWRALKSLPLADLARRIRDRLRDPEADGEGGAAADAPSAATRMVDRWLTSQRLVTAVGERLGVVTLRAWQPVPAYGYDLAFHPFVDDAEGFLERYRTLREGYRLLAEARAATGGELAPENGFLWLADMQRGAREPLYVDAAHYTASFSDRIARRLADHLAPRLGCAAAPSAPAAERAPAAGAPGDPSRARG